MQDLNLLTFLKKGTLFDFGATTSEKNIISELGKPDEVEDYDSKGKYLHYDNLRFFIADDKLDGISLFFINSDRVFEIKVEGDVFTVRKETPLTELLHLLNRLELKWNIPYDQSKLDYLLIEVHPKLSIYYYFENNCLERMSKRFW